MPSARQRPAGWRLRGPAPRSPRSRHLAAQPARVQHRGLGQIRLPQAAPPCCDKTGRRSRTSPPRTSGSRTTLGARRGRFQTPGRRHTRQLTCRNLPAWMGDNALKVPLSYSAGLWYLFTCPVNNKHRRGAQHVNKAAGVNAPQHVLGDLFRRQRRRKPSLGGTNGITSHALGRRRPFSRICFDEPHFAPASMRSSALLA
jgi:hypothetical protein